MVKRPTPESGVQRAVLDLLAAERIFAIRLNTGAFRTESGRPIFMHSGGAGVADILAFPLVAAFPPIFPGETAVSRPQTAVYRPHPLWIEAKSAKGLQTLAQKQFQCKVESEGHSYLLARSSDDVLSWLKGRKA